MAKQTYELALPSFEHLALVDRAVLFALHCLADSGANGKEVDRFVTAGRKLRQAIPNIAGVPEGDWRDALSQSDHTI